MKNLIFVKHQAESSMRFLFEVSADVQVHKGDYVMCDTKYGDAFGIVDSEPFGGLNNEVAARELGVYAPLRLVKQVCSKELLFRANNFERQLKAQKEGVTIQVITSGFANVDEKELPF